jgi:hypothetical protein
MKTTDSLIPYILMTLHPILHISLLVTLLIAVNRNKDEFFKVDGSKCPANSEGELFSNGYKYNLINYAYAMHATSFIL